MLDLHMEANVSPEWLLEQAHLEPGGLAQQTLMQSVIEHMIPYWAYDTGTLANSGVGNPETGEIVYDVPYAEIMYYGIRANGMPVNYHLDKNPQAGAFPFERMLADHATEIVDEVSAVVGNK